jgi:hypothetical protein
LTFTGLTGVKNFFSTSFVDNTSTTGSPKKLIVLGNWWVFVAVSVPLTIVTLYIWWIFQGIHASGRYPGWWKRIANLGLGRSPKKTIPNDEESTIAPVSATNMVEFANEKL